MNRNIENLIKKNFWLKLFSLIFAIIVWGYVVGGTKQDIVYTAGLVIKSLPSGYAVSNDLPKEIHVKLRGSRIALMRLNKKIFFTINENYLLTRKNTIILSRSYLNLPADIKIVSIRPSIIPVIISKVITKYIKILPVVVGRPPAGYYLKNINVFPQYVQVRGPKDIVGHMSVVKTISINLKNVYKSKSLTVSLRKSTKLVKIMYNKKVSVNITISK